MNRASKKIVIGFLSEFDPNDKRVSSGTCYTIAQQLKIIGEIKWIPIHKTRIGTKINYEISRIAYKFNKIFDFYTTTTGSKIGYKYNALEFESCDIIAAYFCMPVLANIKQKKPIIYFTDATYPAMIDYYFHNRWKFNNCQGCKLEQKAMQNATDIVIPSDWAAKSACEDLNIPSQKIHVVEYGANINDSDINFRVRNIGLEDNPQILFLGVDWKRKGGDIALASIDFLNKNGVKATLHIVGIKELDEKIKKLPYVKYHGFLNKNISSDYNKIVDLMGKTDIMLLPTLAECAGIAFAEASGFGIPIFSHITGGVGNYVIDGINGYKLPLGATGEDFGAKILETITNGEISKLSTGERALYKEKLNWNSFFWGGGC